MHDEIAAEAPVDRRQEALDIIESSMIEAWHEVLGPEAPVGVKRKVGVNLAFDPAEPDG